MEMTHCRPLEKPQPILLQNMSESQELLRAFLVDIPSCLESICTLCEIIWLQTGKTIEKHPNIKSEHNKYTNMLLLGFHKKHKIKLYLL